MGLFSRHDESMPEDDFSNVQLPTQEDLNESFLDNGDLTTPARVSARKPHYDIEKAVQLMSGLPDGDPKLVVTIVQKTLESLGVDVSDIIINAEEKETRLNEQHKQLRSSIQQLETQIADKNQQIKSLLEDLKQTSTVKQQLQLAQQQTAKPAAIDSPPNSRPDSVKKPAVKKSEKSSNDDKPIH
ncbi:MAG: hypothetical protein CL693_21895 [Cellvibrionaceae bacterium]|nr:hypothetical protein [Cellvibrionaceae bacterium]|tara:strand:+ start:38470 stop:39024 length:555 start_codon:yes stop_codon:yes gene_type:complete